MRIVTYNTHGSVGMDGHRSTGRIAGAMRALLPDIICFQEIHKRLLWSGDEDQPATIQRIVKRPFHFQANVVFGFGGYGIGIATLAEVRERHEHLLPGPSEQRGALELRLGPIGGLRRVTVFCTHWGLDAAERVEQAKAMAAVINAAPRPWIVCGDFNEGPSGAAVITLREQTGLLDVDSEQNRATFVSDNPKVRIDYILCSPDLMPTNVEVIETQASDHLPVLADIEPIRGGALTRT